MTHRVFVYGTLKSGFRNHYFLESCELLGGAATVSTYKMIENGYHEIILPKFIADHTPVMAAYSAGTVAMDYFVTRRLGKNGHRKLARLVTSIDICQDAPWAIRNLVLTKQQTLSRTPFPPVPPGRLSR